MVRLESIDLSGNRLTDRGVLALVPLLEQAVVLTVLELGNNPLVSMSARLEVSRRLGA